VKLARFDIQRIEQEHVAFGLRQLARDGDPPGRADGLEFARYQPARCFCIEGEVDPLADGAMCLDIRLHEVSRFRLHFAGHQPGQAFTRRRQRQPFEIAAAEKPRRDAGLACAAIRHLRPQPPALRPAPIEQRNRRLAGHVVPPHRIEFELRHAACGLYRARRIEQHLLADDIAPEPCLFYPESINFDTKWQNR